MITCLTSIVDPFLAPINEPDQRQNVVPPAAPDAPPAAPDAPPVASASTSTSAPPEPRLDDIRTEFHPRSGKATVTSHFEDYGHQIKDCMWVVVNDELWHPFRNRLDFDITNFSLRNALNKEETNALLSLLKRAREDEAVTLSSHADMYDILEGASRVLTPVGIWKRILRLYSFFVPYV